MSGESQITNTVYFSDTEGDLARLRGQLLASGFILKSDPRHEIDWDNPHNQKLIQSTRIVFAGDVLKDAKGNDAVYQLIHQLKEKQAEVVLLVGNRDANVLLPMLQLPILGQLLENEVKYWVRGNTSDKRDLNDEETQLLNLAWQYHSLQASGKEDELIDFERKNPEHLDKLKKIALNITAHNLNGRAPLENSVSDGQLVNHLVHVDPQKINFLMYLLQPNQAGLLEMMGVKPEQSFLEKYGNIQRALAEEKWKIPFPLPENLTESQKKLNAAYFHWSTINQQGEPDYFKDKSPAEIEVLAEERLRKSCPGGEYYGYLRQAQGVYETPGLVVTHAKTVSPEAIQHATEVQNDFLEDKGPIPSHGCMLSVVVQGLPSQAREGLSAGYQHSANCESTRRGDNLDMPKIPPIVSVFGHATHAPLTDRYPLVMTLHANGSALFAIDPTHSGENIIAMQERRLSTGDRLLMAVISNKGTVQCTQAIVLDAKGKIHLMSNPEQLTPTADNKVLEKVVGLQRQPYDVCNIDHMHGMTLPVIPNGLLDSKCWELVNVQNKETGQKESKEKNAVQGSAHIYQDKDGRYHLSKYEGYDLRKSHPINSHYLHLLVLRQHLQHHPDVATEERQRIAAAAEKAFQKIDNDDPMKKDASALVKEIKGMKVQALIAYHHNRIESANQPKENRKGIRPKRP